MHAVGGVFVVCCLPSRSSPRPLSLLSVLALSILRSPLASFFFFRSLASRLSISSWDPNLNDGQSRMGMVYLAGQISGCWLYHLRGSYNILFSDGVSDGRMPS